MKVFKQEVKGTGRGLPNKSIDFWLEDVQWVASAKDIATKRERKKSPDNVGGNRQAWLDYVREQRSKKIADERKSMDRLKRKFETADKIDRIEAYKKYVREQGYTEAYIKRAVQRMRDEAS